MSITSGRGPDLARASARSAAKVWAALLVALCAMIAGTNDAYATTTWISASDGNDNDSYIGIVWPYDYPDGRVKALAEFLHYDWDSFSTQTQNDILESHNGQGAFKVLLDYNVKNYRYENTELGFYPNNPISYVQEKMYSLGANTSLYGNDKFWYIACTDEMYQLAIDNINEYLYPHNIEVDEPSVEVTGDYVYLDFTDIIRDSNLNGFSGVRITVTTYNWLLQHQGYYFYGALTSWRNSGTYNTRFGIVCDTKPTIDNNGKIVLTTGTKYTLQTKGTMTNSNIVTHDGKKYIKYDETFITNNISIVTNDTTFGDPYPVAAYYWGNAGAEGGTGGGSDTYEPTPDPTPTHPIIDIGDVTVDTDIDFVNMIIAELEGILDLDPQISIYYSPTNHYTYGGDTTTTSNDVSDILKKILEAINLFRRQHVTITNNMIDKMEGIEVLVVSTLNAVKDAITSLINNLKSQIHNDLSDLSDNIVTVVSKSIDWLGTNLWDNMSAFDSDMLDAIDAAAKYIVDSMDFSDAFSDKDIITWLKRIYGRLQNRKVTVPSVDDDPKGWLDGLNDILNALLDMILSGLNVATLATLFEGLKVRFPISIPWDIAAIVNMFAGGAVSPVFDLPLPKGDGTLHYIHVDLSEWDDEMALVRQGELLLFGIALMMNSKWLFDTMTMSFKRGE